MKLVAYLRVSTDRQAEKGLGLDVQEQAIKKWARANRHRVVLWTRDEGVSGSNGIEHRVGLTEALEALRNGEAKGLLAYNLDRLARTLTVQEAILGHVWNSGARMLTVEDNGEVAQDDPDDPMRTAMRQMRGVFAQLDRAMIVKRMRDGRRTKHEQGGFAYGSPRFGQRVEGGELVTDPDEAKTVERITDLRGQGLSLREIVEILNAEGLRTKRGARWHPGTVARVVNGPYPRRSRGRTAPN